MNSKKKSYSTDAVKIIVAAGALAGSLSLWSMFSNKSIEDANQKLAAGQASGGVAPASAQVVVKTPFQPQPTSTPTQAPLLRVVNINFSGMPTVPQPAISRIVVNSGGSGSAANSSSAAAPAPVTNTTTS
jgi:phosphodiesterase/alkaline phosphatase D-like protein